MTYVAPDVLRTIDGILARLLGWTVYFADDGSIVGHPPGESETHLPVRVPAYSSDLNAMSLAEKEIERRWIPGTYAAVLCRAVGAENGGRFALATASAEARARAAVEVLEAEAAVACAARAVKTGNTRRDGQ